ncbi:MAG: mycothiol synthase [Actinomycetota bacterium]|nr:mycothiol synthase [Actinomycetota bacterium]
MPRVEVKQQMTAADQRAVSALSDRAGRAGVHRFVDADPASRWVMAWGPDGNDPVGFAQVSRDEPEWSLELVVDPRSAAALPAWESLVRAGVDVVGQEGGGPVRVWVHEARPEHDAMAGAAGLDIERELYQMRRPLPVKEPSTLPTRGFVVGRDEQAWLEVNNRAFTGHPDQGGWTLEHIRRLEAEPWFEAEGLLLHEREGRLAGFCWNKVHEGADPPVGELYVVAVDPGFQGLGLGRRLVVAGLDWLSHRRVDDRKLDWVILYVDASNRAALRLYESMGFGVHHADRAYTGVVPPISVPSP